MISRSDGLNADAPPVSLRSQIETFIQERLQTKLEKLLGDDSMAAAEKRRQLHAEHQREAWLADAARRVMQIRLASHTLKPIHPDARGSTVYLQKAFCTDETLVATHTLPTSRADDVVGNAAALDVFKLLKLMHEGKSLLQYALAQDPVLLSAMADEPAQARPWAEALGSVVRGSSALASHTLAKQVFFPLREVTRYHLLAPLYPTALVHAMHLRLQEDRFSDAAKAARTARKDGVAWPHGYSDYPNLAVQNFGGSKPQNISQLNSERGGASHLLPSLPPQWQDGRKTSPPLRWASIFEPTGPLQSFGQIRNLTGELRQFLRNTVNRNNIVLRTRRASWITDILQEVLLYVGTVQELPTGWSLAPACRLHAIEKRWLDPWAVDDSPPKASPDEEIGQVLSPEDAEDAALMALLDDPLPMPPDAQQHIASAFARWLNAAIETKGVTSMADEEFREWKLAFLDRAENLFASEVFDADI